MAIQFANNAATTLFSSVTVSDSQIVVSPGGGALFPNAGSSNYFMVTVVDKTTSTLEIMKVTKRSGDTFTVVRAQEGTTARAFPSGSPVELRLTAQSILDAIDVKIPRGIITMWSGAVDAVPSGWHLCDGTANTPDLRNRFIVGAGNSYAPGNTGGAASRTPAITVNAAATGVQIAGHALTVDQMPAHTHGLTTVHDWEDWQSNHQVGIARGVQYTNDRKTEVTGNGQPHSHDIIDNSHAHTATSTAIDTRPPYYALAFIMKL